MAIDTEQKRRTAVMSGVLPVADSSIDQSDRGAVAWIYYQAAAPGDYLYLAIIGMTAYPDLSVATEEQIALSVDSGEQVGLTLGVSDSKVEI